MLLKLVMALCLCAVPVCAQERLLHPAGSPLPSPPAAQQAAVFESPGLFDARSLGPLEYRQGGVLCLDLPWGRRRCDLSFRGEELMLINREAQGRIRVRIRFGIRP